MSPRPPLNEIQAILAAEIYDEDRSDPSRLYTRATELTARYSTLLAHLAWLREDAVAAMNQDGLSYRQIAQQIGLSHSRVEHMVHAARQRRAKR